MAAGERNLAFYVCEKDRVFDQRLISRRRRVYCSTAVPRVGYNVSVTNASLLLTMERRAVVLRSRSNGGHGGWWSFGPSAPRPDSLTVCVWSVRGPGVVAVAVPLPISCLCRRMPRDTSPRLSRHRPAWHALVASLVAVKEACRIIIMPSRIFLTQSIISFISAPCLTPPPQ